MTFHTVYLSFEEDGRNYIGKHTTLDPYDDYLGSFKDNTFDPTSKIILEYASTEEGALEAELRWQRVFQVVEDNSFANKSYQTSTGFRFKSDSSFWTEERKKLQSERVTGVNNPMYGRVGELNHFFGKSHSSKTIEFLESLAQERAKDPEWLRKTSKKGKKEKESTREKKRRVVRGSWWTSPEGELRRSVDCPGDGWDKRRGGVGPWWVNAKGETRQSEDQPGTDWKRGRKWRDS